MAEPLIWYYADFDGGHSTRFQRFASDEQAIQFYLAMPTCFGLEAVYNCGPDCQTEAIIWEA